MFSSKTYLTRRDTLKKLVKSGVILLFGHNESPINYAQTTYPFRQDSCFLYYFGLNMPNLVAVIDIDNDETIIYGDDQDPADLVWSGPEPTLAELIIQSGVKKKAPLAKLPGSIQKVILQKRQLHIIPTYRNDTSLRLAKLLELTPSKVNKFTSEILIKSIVAQRSCKSPEEVLEIQKAIKLSAEMYVVAKKMISNGIYEFDILAEFQQMVVEHKTRFAFSPTISVHGEFLHNPHYDNKLKNGQLLLIDSGVESPNYYASDITRTYPVNGKMNTKQKLIYDLVLDTQLKAIAAIKPGVAYRDLHIAAAKNIFDGLKSIGLTKGNTDTAIEKGVFSLFYPHGLGHMLGLDGHDMRSLGDQAPGYDDKYFYSNKPGFIYLRLARELQENFVLTVEPGIYFIPMLIDQWEQQNKFKEFINYNELKHFRNFGGVRIEDNILVTKNGAKVLSAKIEK